MRRRSCAVALLLGRLSESRRERRGLLRSRALGDHRDDVALPDRLGGDVLEQAGGALLEVEVRLELVPRPRWS